MNLFRFGDSIINPWGGELVGVEDQSFVFVSDIFTV